MPLDLTGIALAAGVTVPALPEPARPRTEVKSDRNVVLHALRHATWNADLTSDAVDAAVRLGQPAVVALFKRLPVTVLHEAVTQALTAGIIPADQVTLLGLLPLSPKSVVLGYTAAGPALPRASFAADGLDELIRAVFDLGGPGLVSDVFDGLPLNGTISEGLAVDIVLSVTPDSTAVTIPADRLPAGLADRIITTYPQYGGWLLRTYGDRLTVEQVCALVRAPGTPLGQMVQTLALDTYRDEVDVAVAVAQRVHPDLVARDEVLLRRLLTDVTVDDDVLTGDEHSQGWLEKAPAAVTFDWAAGRFPANPPSPQVAGRLRGQLFHLDPNRFGDLRPEDVNGALLLRSALADVPGLPAQLIGMARRHQDTPAAKVPAGLVVLMHVASDVFAGDDRLWAALTGESKVFTDRWSSFRKATGKLTSRWSQAQDRRG
jgi:hypothetical protein